MTLANHLIVFLVCWWLVFFMVLPWGIKGHHETGEDYEPGIEPGSPIKPNMGKKVIITTSIATVIWAIFWAVMTYDLISVSG